MTAHLFRRKLAGDAPVSLEASRWPNEEILRSGRALTEVVEFCQRSVLKHSCGRVGAWMLCAVGLGHCHAHLECCGSVVEEIGDFLLQIIFLEAKASAFPVRQIFEECLFACQAERMGSVGSHEAIVRS